MNSTRFDVVGIGNAIVDVIGRCDEAFLANVGAAKGSMRLVDAAEVNRIYGQMGPAIEISGGSAANTIAGVASFGGKAAFIGSIAKDDFGKIFAHDIRSIGVDFSAPPLEGAAPTSRCLILVTPDGERTMNTFLGISTSFDQSQLDARTISDGGILYLEGYLFDQESAKNAFRAALQIAKKANRKIALSLSDSFCVDRHRADFLALIRSGIDVLFANESEIKSLYQTSSFGAAADAVRKDTALAALTRSGDGSVILAAGKSISISPMPVSNVVDTTGAGDLYAAGFLFGLANDLGFETSGKLASLAASEIIGHIGARPAASLRQLASEQGLIS